jgi:hypothetical protein
MTIISKKKKWKTLREKPAPVLFVHHESHIKSFRICGGAV